MLQDLPLEILIEICLYDYQVGFKLHQTIKKLFLNSKIHKEKFPSENWYRIFQDNLTYIRINNQLKIHSFNDQPFIVTKDNQRLFRRENLLTRINAKIWFKFGLVHRDNDQPAYIDDFEQVWWQFSKIHRNNDLPANITVEGDNIWYQNGRIHRNNDLPTAIYSNGRQLWYQNGKKHRDEDLPAYISMYCKQWYKNGLKHRDNNLPAVEFNDGGKEWWINGMNRV